MSTRASKDLETSKTRVPERDYDPHPPAGVHLPVSEDRATGLRDPASGICADARCVELKSLEALYMVIPRRGRAFHEAVTNRILDDLVAATSPRFMG